MGTSYESTLIDQNPPLEGLLASLSVPLQVTGKGLCLGLHSGKWGYQGLIQREESHDIHCAIKNCISYTLYITSFNNNLPEACITVTHNSSHQYIKNLGRHGYQPCLPMYIMVEVS